MFVWLRFDNLGSKTDYEVQRNTDSAVGNIQTGDCQKR